MSEYPKPNVYTCANRHRTVTVDLVEGTTPMIIDCQTPGCGRDALSGWYDVPPELAVEATHEWYRPTFFQRMRLPAGVRDHVRQGGLLLRPRTAS